MIVPWAAGGPTDILSRLTAEAMGKSMGQAVVVENRPGAAGNIGADAVIKAAPDGYTLLFSINSIVSNPLFEPATSVNPADLAPVAHLASAAGTVSINGSLPPNTLQEFIQYARANRTKITYGAFGPANQFYGEYYNKTQGTEMIMIPYKGNAPIVAAVVSGEISMCFCGYLEVKPHIDSKRVKVLAFAGGQRLPQMPNVPTQVEQGIPQVFEGWFAIWAPKATPPAVIDRLSTEAVRAVKLPDVSAKALDLALIPSGLGPQGLREQMEKFRAQWEMLIKTTGIKPGG